LRTLLPQRCFTPTIRNHICAGFAFFFGRESYACLALKYVIVPIHFKSFKIHALRVLRVA